LDSKPLENIPKIKKDGEESSELGNEKTSPATKEVEI
jgi:hypothetical protein